MLKKREGFSQPCDVVGPPTVLMPQCSEQGENRPVVSALARLPVRACFQLSSAFLEASQGGNWTRNSALQE